MPEPNILVISALELMSRNIFCGSVRIVYAIIYTLFLVSNQCLYYHQISLIFIRRVLASQSGPISTLWLIVAHVVYTIRPTCLRI